MNHSHKPGQRAWNFSAGPAALPESVLEHARDELLDFRGSGASVMEVSHRGPVFAEVAEAAESDLRALAGVPRQYQVLFLQGGATQQFAQVPMNLAGPGESADYVISGHWAAKAAQDAGELVDVHVAADSGKDYRSAPDPANWQRSDDAAYLHFTPNETIHGVEFHTVPDTGDVPLVADMSSDILSRPMEIERYGMIYAGAQKNIAASGLTLVIIREDLLERRRREVPRFLRYAEHAKSGSMLNTPNTFGWYLAGLTFRWLIDQGGLAAIGERNAAKAELLYGAIDASGGFYRNPVEPGSRSRMNVPFTLADARLDGIFLSESADADMIGLKGHRALGGMRASLYNAMPLSGVQALVDFMHDFRRRHG